mgnify:CR=1 FL=1
MFFFVLHLFFFSVFYFSIVVIAGTPGFSGAELANIINQAALKASQDGLKAVDLATLEWAKDKILMGAGSGCFFFKKKKKNRRRRT